MVAMVIQLSTVTVHAQQASAEHRRQSWGHTCAGCVKTLVFRAEMSGGGEGAGSPTCSVVRALLGQKPAGC